MAKKKVIFVHYRSGERDGVSMEIEKRATVASKLEWNVGYLSGYDGLFRNSVYVIKELDIMASYNRFLQEYCFDDKIFDESAMVALYYQIENKIYKKMKKMVEQLKPDLLYVHNMFSHTYNLPGSTALMKLLDRYQIPTVAVHHDFWFERKQFLKPRYAFLEEILESMPPNRPYIVKHEVINSLAYEELLRRRAIESDLTYDYFDFNQPIPKTDEFNSDLRSYFGISEYDILVLHATRITERKGIENAIRFVRQLELRLKKQRPKEVLGRPITKDSRVVMLFPNFIEVNTREYVKKLRKLADSLKVRIVWAGEKFMWQRKQENGMKFYGYFDAYVASDLVTYTSLLEGYGNQFLEAMFFKKLTVVYEYPVFLRDIKSEGYSYVSLGNEVSKKNGLSMVRLDHIRGAVEETVGYLSNPKMVEKMTKKNFSIAKRYHDQSKLVANMKNIMAKV